MNYSGPGLYVHVPFCSAVCPYCDFAVTTSRPERRTTFVDTLLLEAERVAAGVRGFDTLYLGGGTPSLLETDDLARMLEGLRGRLEIENDCWILLEANPEDVNTDRLDAWKQLGVRTLSLGVQSFDDRALRFLGRRHSAAQARTAVEQSLQAGFSTVSLDLIYGLPDRSATDWDADLETAIDLRPQHVSCYNLTYHSNTPFGRWLDRGELSRLGEHENSVLFRKTHERLNGAGLGGYEVSNFAAATEHRSRHNVKYWTHTPYLGLGPSAHSFAGATRWWNVRDLKSYERSIRAGDSPLEGRERLSKAQLALECLMLGLRSYAGVDLTRLNQDFGVDLVSINADLIEQLESEGFLESGNRRLVPTLRGLAVADGLARSFSLN